MDTNELMPIMRMLFLMCSEFPILFAADDVNGKIFISYGKSHNKHTVYCLFHTGNQHTSSRIHIHTSTQAYKQTHWQTHRHNRRTNALPLNERTDRHPKPRESSVRNTVFIITATKIFFIVNCVVVVILPAN